MKTAERELARRLRREQGLSVKHIARLVGVSQSSISLWVRDIELTPEQRARLRPCGVAGGASRRAHALTLRRQAQSRGRTIARRIDPLHIAGCMLYWAEGSRSRNAVEFTNSDVEMVEFFLTLLRECFHVPDVDRQREVERFWLERLGLPAKTLRKSTVNRYSKYSHKKRRNKLPHGTCRLVVYDTALVQQIYGAIQAYGGFEREEWAL